MCKVSKEAIDYRERLINEIDASDLNWIVDNGAKSELETRVKDLKNLLRKETFTLRVGNSRKHLEYFKDGIFVAEGSYKELMELTGFSLSKLHRLKNRSLHRDFEKYIDNGTVTEYILDVTDDVQYILQNDNELPVIGTIEEISERTGLKISTLRFYATRQAAMRGYKRLSKLEQEED